MGLKAVIESLDDVAEPLREHYTESDDGTFRLDAEGVEDVSGLKSALKKERDAAKTALSELKRFKGLDPDEARAAQEKLEKLQKKAEGGDDDAAKQLTALKKKWQDETEGLVNEQKAESKKWREKFRATALGDKVKAAALKAGVNAEDVEDVLVLTRNRFDLDDDDKPIVLDEDGDPRGLSREKFFAEEYKKERPKFFKGTGVSGSGTQRSSSRGGAESSDDMTSTQKIAAGFKART